MRLFAKVILFRTLVIIEAALHASHICDLLLHMTHPHVPWSVCLSVCLSLAVLGIMFSPAGPAKADEPIEIPDRVEPRNHLRLSDWVHTDAAWQIRLKYPCAEAMLPYVE